MVDSDAPCDPGLHDRQLVQRACGGDGIAQGTFAQRMTCVPRFLRCRNERFGRPLGEHDLQDLAQEVIATIWTKLASFEGKATLETWVYRFCDLHLRNAVRSVRRQQRSSHGSDGLDQVMAHDAGLSLAVDLHAAMAKLPELDVRILREKHFDGRTFEDIAARLAASTNTVKSRYYRALVRLRATLDEPRKREVDG